MSLLVSNGRGDVRLQSNRSDSVCHPNHDSSRDNYNPASLCSMLHHNNDVLDNYKHNTKSVPWPL